MVAVLIDSGESSWFRLFRSSRLFIADPSILVDFLLRDHPAVAVFRQRVSEPFLFAEIQDAGPIKIKLDRAFEGCVRFHVYSS